MQEYIYMKNSVRLASTILMIGIFVFVGNSQITIKIPKIPKIGTNQPSQPTAQTGNSSGDADLRNAFYDENRGVLGYVAVLMRFYRSDMTGDVNMLNPANEAEWQTLMTRLADLDRSCTTKYQRITDDPSERPNRINRLPKTWCVIAANRVEYEKLARGEAKDDRAQVFIGIWRDEIERVTRSTDGFVSDLVQRMMFDPTWKTEKFAEVQKVYASGGLGTPSMSMFDAIKPDLDKVRVIIDRDSKANSWEVPPHKEPAIENFAKQRFVTHPYYKGSTVLKIGSNYRTWKVYKNSIGIPTNQYKRGNMLVKRPEQPGLCQNREWIVKQEYIGGGRFGPMKMEGMGEGGKYVKCQ